jgi:hypothetical protein
MRNGCTNGRAPTVTLTPEDCRSAEPAGPPFCPRRPAPAQRGNNTDAGRPAVVEGWITIQTNGAGGRMPSSVVAIDSSPHHRTAPLARTESPGMVMGPQTARIGHHPGCGTATAAPAPQDVQARGVRRRGPGQLIRPLVAGAHKVAQHMPAWAATPESFRCFARLLAWVRRRYFQRCEDGPGRFFGLGNGGFAVTTDQVLLGATRPLLAGGQGWVVDPGQRAGLGGLEVLMWVGVRTAARADRAGWNWRRGNCRRRPPPTAPSLRHHRSNCCSPMTATSTPLPSRTWQVASAAPSTGSGRGRPSAAWSRPSPAAKPCSAPA